MKKLFSIVTAFLFIQYAGAQDSVLLYNGTLLQGQVRNDISRSGTLTFIDGDNRKQSFDASLVKEASIDHQRYISYKNDFFVAKSGGSRIQLFQKLTDNDGRVAYNGTEAMVMTGSEGKKGDYFFSAAGAPSLTWIRKKDYLTSLKTLASGCPAVMTELGTGKTEYNDLPRLFTSMNNCQ